MDGEEHVGAGEAGGDALQGRAGEEVAEAVSLSLNFLVDLAAQLADRAQEFGPQRRKGVGPDRLVGLLLPGLDQPDDGGGQAVSPGVGQPLDPFGEVSGQNDRDLPASAGRADGFITI